MLVVWQCGLHRICHLQFQSYAETWKDSARSAYNYTINTRWAERLNEHKGVTLSQGNPLVMREQRVKLPSAWSILDWLFLGRVYAFYFCAFLFINFAESAVMVGGWNMKQMRTYVRACPCAVALHQR